jgi:hypothetical protein
MDKVSPMLDLRAYSFHNRAMLHVEELLIE